jgi:Tfp pilus assembly PilM family ATPase
VDEIRGSVDYYASQQEVERVSAITITGGASLSAGLVNKLEQTVRVEVRRGAPLSQMNYGKSGLNQAQAVQVEPVAAAAIGLALGTDRS